jgi:hypothetical protein
MRSLILRDEGLTGGFEYGALRSFEDAIVKQANARTFELPHNTTRDRLERRCGHGTRYDGFRRWLPKRKLHLPEVDILWLVLMGPENYRLDTFAGWEKSARYKVIYIFDTFPSQYGLIRQLLSNSTWNLFITSFNESVPDLEMLTKHKWHHVDQAVNLDFFQPSPIEERVIHFSAYGRRHPLVHDAVVEFATKYRLIYDFSTRTRPPVTSDVMGLLEQYALNLSRSVFTFSWPVEVTNPARSGGLSPITCRWFEAAAAAVPVIGQAPSNLDFGRLFGKEFVVSLLANRGRASVVQQLELIWSRRFNLVEAAIERRHTLEGMLGWAERVNRILQLITDLDSSSACRLNG